MKQVLLMRTDLKMSPGKLAAQAAHAAVKAAEVAPRKDLDEWNTNGCTKIVLAIDSEVAAIDFYKAAVAAYLPVSLICDEGRTEVRPGTVTGVGIGPAPDGHIDAITGHLELYGKA